MNLARLIVVGWCGISLLLVGCSEGSKHPKTYPVQGELFVKGQPADGATVILHPAPGADLSLWPRGFPTARVEPDGKFQFSCFAENDGAPEGSYKLIARWDEGDESSIEDRGLPRPKNRINAIYFDPARSPWSVTVEPKPNQLTRYEVP